MADWAVIPKIWHKSRVFVIGGGPSAKDFNWDCLKGRNVVGCNAATFLLPSGIVQWGIFGDMCFLGNFRSDLRKFVDGGGNLVNVTGKNPDDKNHWMLTVRRINGRKAWGLSDDPGSLRWNRSTGACAIGLAYLLGAAEVVLIGFDMKAPNDKVHNWHNVYDPFYVKRTKENNTWWMPRPRVQIYSQMMLRAFNEIAEDAAKLGITVWNTNFDSAIRVFPFRPISELL